MNSNFCISVCQILGTLSGCSTRELRVQEFKLALDTPNPNKPPEEFYVIGGGDSININVWKEPLWEEQLRFVLTVSLRCR